MKTIGRAIDFNQLAEEIGIEVESLPMLFNAMERECSSLFPQLISAILLQDFSEIHKNAHALKGIIGNMHLDDLYEMITNIDNAAKASDFFLYQDTLLIIKQEVEAVLAQFFSSKTFGS